MRFSLVAVAGLSLLTWADPAFACSCIRDLPPQTAAGYRQWLERFDGAVFRGTVIDMEQNGMEWRFTFKVERHWKGVKTADVVVRTPLNEAACGVEFALGASYLVVAITPERRTNLCLSFNTVMEQRLKEVHGEGSFPPKP